MSVRVPHRPINVTPEIQLNHKIYGGSDHNTPWSFAASKSLNYVDGPTLQRPANQAVYAIESVERYEDSVGLFGGENKFIKYFFDLQSVSLISCFDDDVDFCCAKAGAVDELPLVDYEPVDGQRGTVPVQETYDQALWHQGSAIDPRAGRLISVEVINHGTGNKHVDDWFDVRIYTPDRFEHPFNKAYLKHNQHFYVGFHARNTRRLPYKVDVRLGAELIKPSEVEDPRLILRPQWQGSY